MKKLRQLPNVLVPVSAIWRDILTRRELAMRWRCSGETIKRRQRRGYCTRSILARAKFSIGSAKSKRLKPTEKADEIAAKEKARRY